VGEIEAHQPIADFDERRHRTSQPQQIALEPINAGGRVTGISHPETKGKTESV
jgi:hypothetical protein